MSNPLYYVPLFVGIRQADDLAYISAMTQDSLCPITGMHFYESDEKFTLLLHRFCWELEEHMQELTSYYRVHSALSFQGVKRVMKRNFHQASEIRMLNLLSISYRIQKDESVFSLLFSGDMEISITCREFNCLVKDYESPWPTHSKPIHMHDHVNEIMQAM